MKSADESQLERNLSSEVPSSKVQLFYIKLIRLVVILKIYWRNSDISQDQTTRKVIFYSHDLKLKQLYILSIVVNGTADKLHPDQCQERSNGKIHV